MMEVLQFELNEIAFEQVAKRYGRDEKSFDEDVKTIEDWLRTQPHLPEILDRIYLKNFLVSCKFSVEKAKQCIDNYYTMRDLNSEIFELCNPKVEDLKQTMDGIYFVPLPKQTKEGYRVFVFKIKDLTEVEKVNLNALAARVLLNQEMRFNEDCVLGDVVMVDFKDITLNVILKITPTLVARTLAIYEKIYSIPLKAVYIVNSPAIAEIFIKILKGLMKEKLFKRIIMSPDTSIVLQRLPKEIVPKDYGGDERSLDELQMLWIRKVEQYQWRFDQLKNLKVDESLRPEKLNNDELLGFHGNFKKLTVD